MDHVPNKTAENLRDAFNVLDPRRPITSEQISTFFVERPGSPVKKMRVRLENSASPENFLFVGHRGAGKSSDLEYLASQLSPEDFLCVLVPVRQIFRSPSVAHSEVLLSMSTRLIKAATDEKILGPGILNILGENLLDPIFNFLKRILVSTTPAGQETIHGELKTEINAVAVKIESKIGTEPQTRDQIRGYLATRINEMIGQINQLVLAVRIRLKKQVVFIVEELDKFDRKDTEALFLQHAQTLTSTSAHSIFSFPVSMRYTNEFSEIRTFFSNVFYLHNVPVKHRDGSPDEAGREVMRKIAKRRVAAELLGPGVLGRAVDVTGGHVKTFIQLLQSATLNAMLDGKQVVELPHLEQAAKELRDQFVGILSAAQLDLLRHFRDDPQKNIMDVHAEKQSVLYNGSLFEYENTIGLWADVNPVILELLDRRA